MSRFISLMLLSSVVFVTTTFVRADSPINTFSSPNGIAADSSVLRKPTAICNPIISNKADPWIIRDGKQFIWCFTEKDLGISLYITDSMDKLGEKHLIWTSPNDGPFSKQVWAPELHYLDGHWYVYFAASDGKNENHQAYVLKSKTSDPLSEYEVLGPFYTGDDFSGKTNSRWAIDMTILEHNNKRYAIWSGWQDEKDEQHLFIAPMENPWTLAAARTRLCENNDYLWERTEETEQSRGLSEGPQVLQWQGRTFIVYSCAASWLPTYKLGMLELVGDDPLNPKCWKKYPEPVFQGTETVYGLGHACFVSDPTEAEPSRHWIFFHAKRTRQMGWLRDVFMQPFSFDQDGLPVFGRPVERKTHGNQGLRD
ncbi:MAG: glycoside hydrolase family 43 protein [Thermoguttaceae bacterium]